MSKGYAQYKRTSVLSASREQLLLMLYEAAIRYVKRAVVGMETNDLAEKGIYIGKAYDVVAELSNSLNLKVGGDLAKNLESLYNYMIDELTKANINNEVKHLHNVLKVLDTLNAGWKQAVESLRKSKMTQGSQQGTSVKAG